MTISSPERESEPVRFSELFNARCEELGLLSAPEIAQRISAVQPSTANVDLARSVRNWQADRNVPRSDFYRIILEALEIDEAQRAVWHRAYSEAKSGARASAAGETPAQADSPAQASTGDEGGLEVGRAVATQPVSRHRRPRPSLLRTGRAAAAVVVCVLIAGAATVGLYANANGFGPACDASAGARWDPQRNTAIAALDFRDIRASAVEACEAAVREHPKEGRYWFQLGRAHDRDARWHGNYSAAYWAFRRAHELDYAAAALSLGMLHEDGLTTPNGIREPNPGKAAAFYEQAAAAGLAMGHYCHAIATLFGWSGERPDPSGATRAAEAAVTAGSHRALGLVADLTAKAPRTRHVECSPEHGVERPPAKIAWGSESAEAPM